MDQDIQNAPLEIRTLSGLNSDQKVFLRFYTNQKTDAGGISIMFSSPPQYQLLNCSVPTNFLEDLPSEKNKTWTITVDKSAGIKMMVYCNKVLVVNALLSNEMCIENSSSWSKYWSGYIRLVKFVHEDTASTYYKPSRGKFRYVFQLLFLTTVSN